MAKKQLAKKRTKKRRPRIAQCDPSPDVQINVCETNPMVALAHYHNVVQWLNPNPQDCTVNFSVDGEPLDQPSFTIPAASNGIPGCWDTVVTTKQAGTYHYKCPCCKMLGGGQPIIIIQ